jgi:hypothetical protein
MKHESLKCDHGVLTKNHDELLRVSQNMEARMTEYRENETETYMQVQESIEKANEALLENQKVQLREEKLQKEVLRLEDKIVDAHERYRDKAETEIATIRTQFIAEKNRLNGEISDLENSCSKMKVMAERAIREKR